MKQYGEAAAAAVSRDCNQSLSDDNAIATTVLSVPVISELLSQGGFQAAIDKGIFANSQHSSHRTALPSFDWLLLTEIPGSCTSNYSAIELFIPSTF